MYDVAVILGLHVEFDLYVSGVPAQIVSGQIDQHDVFRILFRVVQQLFGQLFVFYGISRSAGGTGDRVDAGDAVGNFTVCFGR